MNVGEVRVGTAQACLDITLALPVKTLKVQTDGSELEEFAPFIREEVTTVVFVGLPRLLNGEEGEAVRVVRSYARRLARKISPILVRLTDERSSSVTAHEKLRAAGVSIREHRKMADQIAAQQILGQAMETFNTGTDLTGGLVITD